MQTEMTNPGLSMESFTISIHSDEPPRHPVQYAGHLVSRSPTKLELHQALAPVLKNIYRKKEKKLSLCRITPIILKNTLLEIKEKPFMAPLKCGVIFICCYMLKNLIEGIIGGEALFANFSLTEGMFSSDATTQINAGGLITNAAADVNFTIDSLFVGYAIYWLSIRNAYHKAGRDITNKCFDQYLEGEKGENLSWEERSELYELKNQELSLYDRVPFKQMKIPSKIDQKVEEGGDAEASNSSEVV